MSETMTDFELWMLELKKHLMPEAMDPLLGAVEHRGVRFSLCPDGLLKGDFLVVADVGLVPAQARALVYSEMCEANLLMAGVSQGLLALHPVHGGVMHRVHVAADHAHPRSMAAWIDRLADQCLEWRQRWMSDDTVQRADRFSRSAVALPLRSAGEPASRTPLGRHA